LNITAQLYEATDEIGGTWSYNTYPGCACDVMSHLYSFSFEMNPGLSSLLACSIQILLIKKYKDWSEKYSPRKEIHDYMKMVAKKYKVYEHTQFETEVVRTSWIQHKNQWELELKMTGEKENEIKNFDFM
jgi:cation diffusion facilitator CzcD-associated flavoprotein CzcO